jgi:hypothetical protein
MKLRAGVETQLCFCLDRSSANDEGKGPGVLVDGVRIIATTVQGTDLIFDELEIKPNSLEHRHDRDESRVCLRSDAGVPKSALTLTSIRVESPGRALPWATCIWMLEVGR